MGINYSDGMESFVSGPKFLIYLSDEGFVHVDCNQVLMKKNVDSATFHLEEKAKTK